MSEAPHHDRIDAGLLDEAGDHFCYWMDRLTGDQLHNKSDIARVLGWYRCEVERLRKGRLRAEMEIVRSLEEEYLVEEIARRRRSFERIRRRPSFHFCHQCAHFESWRGDLATIPGDYNPCTQGHEMSFRMPDNPNPHDDSWGFYRRGCRDREIPDPKE